MFRFQTVNQKYAAAVNIRQSSSTGGKPPAWKTILLLLMATNI